MKGYVHTTKSMLVGQHNVTVKDGIREVECDLQPVAADMRGGTVYETHAAAETALHAHHEDLAVGLDSIQAMSHKVRGKASKPETSDSADTAMQVQRDLVARNAPGHDPTLPAEPTDQEPAHERRKRR